VEIFNPENELLTSFEGKTDQTGNFETGFFIFNKTLKGTYTVKISVGPENNQTTETLSMVVLGDRS